MCGPHVSLSKAIALRKSGVGRRGQSLTGMAGSSGALDALLDTGFPQCLSLVTKTTQGLKDSSLNLREKQRHRATPHLLHF